MVKASVIANPPLSSNAQIDAWSASVSRPSRHESPATSAKPVGRSTSLKLHLNSLHTSPSSPIHTQGSDTNVFFKHPRQLHQTVDPVLLSSLPTPIQAVLEDMREQRMSLVQSLRQYVFAHRVILEGAISLIREMNHQQAESQPQLQVNPNPLQQGSWKQKNALQNVASQLDSSSTSPFALGASFAHPLNISSSTSSLSEMLPPTAATSTSGSLNPRYDSDPYSISPSISPSSPSPSPDSLAPSPIATGAVFAPFMTNSHSPSPPRAMAGRLSSEACRGTYRLAPSLSSASPPRPPPVLTGKRSHSPSRWTKYGANGENMAGSDSRVPWGQGLNKRPSVKRKHRSNDSIEQSSGGRSPPRSLSLLSSMSNMHNDPSP